MTAAELDDHLPGGPSKLLVRRVRRCLKGYGVRPHSVTLWRLAWAWAHEVATSYQWADRRTHWPCTSDIAAQYHALLLAEARTTIKLPFRAMDRMPEAVKAFTGRETYAALVERIGKEQQAKGLPAALPKELPAHQKQPAAPTPGRLF